MKKTFFTAIIFFITAGCVLSFAADKKIGVSMPDQSVQRWKIDASNIKKGLEQKGYEVFLEFAEGKASLQNKQIESLILQGVELLIIAPVESADLSKVLAFAKKNKIKTIAYERFIRNSRDIDCYIAFDAYRSGFLEAAIIVRELGLNIQQKGPFYMEIFSVPLKDENSRLYYRGAMDAFAPYIQKGRLRIVSGQVSLQASAMKNWSSQEAQNRMEELIAKFYGSLRLDAILSADDIFADGIIRALKKAGYKVGDDKNKKPFPIVTGQDCRKENLKLIIDRQQKGSIFKDYRILAAQAVKTADDILNGRTLDINDRTTYRNGSQIIPAYLCEPMIIYKENMQKELFDSKYYKKSEILKIKNK
jgi:putative multiple sugar transport system substrate-binding protein